MSDRWWMPSLFTPEEKALLRFATLTLPTSTERIPPLVGWEEQALLRIAQAGKLLPVLGAKLTQANTTDLIVQNVIKGWSLESQQKLSTGYRHAWVLAERRKILMNLVRQVLHNNQIPYALHKGMGYMASLYTDDAARLMNDVDILVDPKHKHKAQQTLERVGFVPIELDPPHPCAQLFRREDQHFYLDLHTRISWPSHTRIPVQALVKQATEHSTVGDPFFGPTAQFLFHIYHMCKEQLLREHVPLRAYMELRELYLQLQDSLPSVVQRAKRWGLFRVLRCGLWLLHEAYPGLLCSRNVPSASGLTGLIRWIRHMEANQYDTQMQTIIRGIFLAEMVDHSMDRMSYVSQRIWLETVKKYRNHNKPSGQGPEIT